MSAAPNAARRAVGGAGYLLLGAFLIQWSAAIVNPAFATLGAAATSGWRFLLGAIILLVATRPRLRSFTKEQWLGALVLGAAVAFMNQCFYEAIARVPLGGAVAIEYLGPFFVSALGKRSWRHLGFVALAGLGVLALTRPGSGLTALGILFALGSGAGWALYVFASHHVGAKTRGFDGLAASMTVAAVLTLPMSLGRWGAVTHHPALLGRLSLVALMAIVLGFAAEMQALRRLKPTTAGVLMALDPAIAFGVGWLALAQRVSVFDFIGLLCVIVAGVAVTYDSAAGVAEVA